MRAVQISCVGGPEVLDVVDLPDPVPGGGEQLHEVQARDPGRRPQLYGSPYPPAMRAVQITRFGGPEVLDVVDLPDPVPGDGQQQPQNESSWASRSA
jgi:hypothetical protein